MADKLNHVQPLALRSRDAARALGVSENFLLGLAQRREVRHVMIGDAPLFPIEFLREWLIGQAVPAKQ